MYSAVIRAKSSRRNTRAKSSGQLRDVQSMHRESVGKPMFKVKNIYTGEIHTVYGLNGTSFLFFWGFDEKGYAQWGYGDINAYVPMEGLDENRHSEN